VILSPNSISDEKEEGVEEEEEEEEKKEREILSYSFSIITRTSFFELDNFHS